MKLEVASAALILIGLSRLALSDQKEPSSAPPWVPPQVVLSTKPRHPVVAATAEELARLRTAWARTDPERDALARRITRADESLKSPLIFPPEGGQHNQWYQCEKCQVALATVDAHRHRCPKCGTVFSGFPFDNVLYSKTHGANIMRAEDAAWAWAVTGQQAYADFAARVLVGYAERYLDYPMVHAAVNDKSVNVAAGKNGKYRSAGHINEQTLGEAAWLISIATSYDLIADSGALDEERKKQVETRLIRAMADCIGVNRTGKTNWQTWHNAALLNAGAVLGDEALVRQAILDPNHGFVFQMKASVTADGMWYENSWAYHYYALKAMVRLAEGARRLGLDLYGHPLLRKMCLVGFDYRMTDGSLPRFGDAVQDSLARPDVNEFAYAAYGDERLLATLPEPPSWDSVLLGRPPVKKGPPFPPVPSRLMPAAGHALLRTNGPGALSAAVTFGPYGGFHGHFDKLSFVFFGCGQELGVDPGRAASQAYRLPIHRHWYKASVGHSVALVDGRGQEEADGKLLSFAANGAYAAVAADAGPAFPNVTHRRFLLLTPTYLLVADELRATDGREHVYDWLYHNKGLKVLCNLPAGEAALGGTPGYAYLRDVAAYRLDGEATVRADFVGEKITTRLVLAGRPGDTVFTATGPLQSVDDRVPMAVVRRRGEAVRFLAVIAPAPQDGNATAPEIRAVSELPLTVSVTSGAVTDRISLPGEAFARFRVWQETPDGEAVTLLTSEDREDARKRPTMP